MTGQAARPGRHCFSFILWFAGYDFENRGLHRDYQVNSVRHCRGPPSPQGQLSG